MKKIYTSMLALLLIATISKGQSYTLTVNDGYGSEEYTEGDTVHVWSRAITGDSIFSHWSGNGVPGLINGDEWHSQLVVPVGTSTENVMLTAHYDVIPSETQIGVDSFNLFGKNFDAEFIETHKTVYYGIPPNPKGLIFLFHGTGGSSRSFFVKYERYQMVKELIFAGYAIVSVDANEATIGDINGDEHIRWNNNNADDADETNNIDIKNMGLTRDSILEKFNLPSDIPTFGLGMSNGANFVDLCAAALDYNATAHITAKGNYFTYLRDDIVPVIWIASENDHQEFADNNQAFLNFEKVQAVHPASEFHWFRRSPAYPERFFRNMKNISLNKSIQIYNTLEAQGHLDENKLLIALETDNFYLDLMEDNNNFGLNSSKRKSIREELLCINADHVLHSDYDKAIIRFFNQHLLPTATSETVIDNSNVSVHPNPFSASTVIEFDNPYHISHHFSLFDITGKVVQQVTDIHSHQIELDRKNLIDGIYIFQIQSINGIQTGRLIVKS